MLELSSQDVTTNENGVSVTESSDERAVPIYCPNCATQVRIKPGLCGNRVLEAIILQSERLGTEIRCVNCETTFVYQKLAVYNRATEV